MQHTQGFHRPCLQRSMLRSWRISTQLLARMRPFRLTKGLSGAQRQTQHRPMCNATEESWGRMDSIWSTTAKKAAAEAPAPTVTPETYQYWQQCLGAVDKPAAKKLIENLDMTNPLGIKHSLGQRRGARYSKAPLYSFFLETKQQHPTKVLLVRVGEFYETMGTDAVLLVQHAGLNAMGQGDPPRAGCPIGNLRRTVSDLVEQAGLSVVVCEETPQSYSYGSKTKMKKRFIGGVVTPAQPQYLYGLVDDRADAHDFQGTPPILGIAASVGGYKVMEIDVDMLTCQVTEGLTEDAVSARLHQGGLVPPLYLHSSIRTRHDGRLTEATVEAEWEQRVSQLFRSQVGVVKRYADGDAVQELLNLVRLELGMSPDTQFLQVTSAATYRPKPVYKSTACQLGIHKTAGVWPLIDSLLPAAAGSMLIRRWLRRLLLLPPPTAVAKSISSACCFLADVQAPLPMYPMMATNNIVLKLRACEANDIFFRDLSTVLGAVHETIETPALTPFAAAVLPVVLEETKNQVDLPQLAQACRLCMEQIRDVIEEEDEAGAADAACQSSNAEASSSDSQAPKGGMEVLGRLFLANEDFRGRVRRTHIRKEVEAVEAAGEKVESALMTAFSAISEYSQQHDPAKSRPVLVYDPVNSAVWIKLDRKSQAAKQAEIFGLIHPHDRNGKSIPDRHCTAEVEKAMDDYRKACDQAHGAVRHQMQELSRRLQESMVGIVAGNMFAVVAAALISHVDEAQRRKWTLPTQLAKGAESAGQGMMVQGMWPYWLDGHSPSTVKNSFDMDSMYLLTGPNMAGKSTILRSVCAVALLSACGLYAPVQSAIMPYIDAFMLRNFSADSPLEGKSSFAVEMVEMRYVMDDVTADSLVLVDELGKGTEVRAGAAIAAAMLEKLDSIGCRGIFATHLHQLLEMPIDTPSMVNMMMETRPATTAATAATAAAATTAATDAIEASLADTFRDELGNDAELAEHRQQLGTGGRVPTWRMVPGSSTESLALDVALQCLVPFDVVHRAAHLFKELEHKHQHLQTLSAIISQERPGHSTNGDGQLAAGNLPSASHQDSSASFELSSDHKIGTADFEAAEKGSQAPSSSQASPSVEDAAQLLQSVAQSVLLSLDIQDNPSEPPQTPPQTPAQTPSAQPQSPGQQAQSVLQSEAKAENLDQLNGITLRDRDQEQMHAASSNDNGNGRRKATAFSPPQSNGLWSGQQNPGPQSLQLHPRVIRGGQMPPPSTVGCSCVYVLRRSDGRFYCGQTDELKGRLTRHRKAGRVKGGPSLEAAYLVLPADTQGASAAKAIEAQLIQALQAEGYPLLSATDARNRQVPKAKQAPKARQAPKAKQMAAATA